MSEINQSLVRGIKFASFLHIYHSKEDETKFLPKLLRFIFFVFILSPIPPVVS